VTAGNATCEGNQVNFVITQSNQGGQPMYEWFVNNQSVFNGENFVSSILKNGDKVKVTLVSDDECALPKEVTSDEITMNLSNKVTPIVSIFASKTSICKGDEIDFSVSSQSNEGNSPSYKWLVNGNSEGNSNTFSTTSLNDGDVVKVEMTSSETCVTNSNVISSGVSITVASPVIPTINIALKGMTFPICKGKSAVFEATTSNGGPNETINWSINGVQIGGQNSEFTVDNIVDGTFVNASLNSSLPCVTSSTATSNIVFAEVNVCTGIVGLLNDSDYEIFPNPASGVVHIKGESIDLVTIINSDGEMVEVYQVDGNQIDVDLSSQSSGLYLIKINANNKQLVRKVYKN
jgi:hypothetical protein